MSASLKHVLCLAIPFLLGAQAHAAGAPVTDNRSNPAISLVLEGRHAYSTGPEDYRLPGFQLGGEAGLDEPGFSAGHSELTLSANADDLFYGELTAALATHDGATEVELEEAYLQTLGLPGGFTLRAGKFFSALGYLNGQHAHAWDFVDAPLVYRGLFGDQLNDTGVQLRWLAPAELFLVLGAEALRGADFPAAGDAHDGNGAHTLFARLGGDAGASHSWQAGISWWQARVIGRTGEAHDHGGAAEIPSFSGDSRIAAIDLVWKWAPEGNRTRRNLKLQAEYFQRREDGAVILEGSSPLEATSYDGRQSGWYAQAVYQFMPRWRAGLRHDRLHAGNRGSDPAVLEEAGLDDAGHTPQRHSLMLDYSRSEFSRLRLQYNRDQSYTGGDDQIYLQYLLSLGAHGAHRF